MGIFGKILAAPIRIANVPMRAIEDGVAYVTDDEPERIISAPLEEVAQCTEKVSDEAADYLRGQEER